MATQQQVDALHAQLQTALGVFQEHEIAQALREEAEQRVIAAEAQRISTVPLPALTTEQWAELNIHRLKAVGWMRLKVGCAAEAASSLPRLRAA